MCMCTENNILCVRSAMQTLRMWNVSRIQTYIAMFSYLNNFLLHLRLLVSGRTNADIHSFSKGKEVVVNSRGAKLSSVD